MFLRTLMPAMRGPFRHLGWAAIVVVLAGAARAAPSPREIRQQIDAVDRLLAKGKSDEAAASLAAGLEGLAAMPQPSAGFRFLADRAERARAKLEKAGVDVARLIVPGPPAGEPARPAGRPAVGGGQPAVSFARDVAPFLVDACGRCHVSGRKGDFQMASYQQLMQSAKVSPGMGNMSELIEVILSGDMPPGGGRVPPESVGMLIKWIDAGAACDADPTADLAMVARAAAAPAAPAIQAPPRPVALKPGDVSFASDVVPVLLDQCANCHGERDPESNLAMTSLESLVKGGRTGPAIVPGKSADSLLVKKIRGVGIEGQRMPLGKPPLSDDQIAMIAKWIDQGGRIDLLTAADSLDKVAAAGRGQRLSAAQLATVRFAAAEKLWGRIIPDEPPVVAAGDGLCLIGNLAPGRMEPLSGEASEVARSVGREFGLDGDSLVKGGVVIYAFRKIYDYSELWQVLLKAERPRGLEGHASVSGDVAYGAFVVPASDASGDETRLLLAEQIAAAAMAARGLPDWFSAGVGRAIAIRVAPKAIRGQDWKREAGSAIKQLGSAADFLSGRADRAAVAAAGGGFIASLAGSGKLPQFVTLIDGGTPFEEAFAKTFRSPPQQAFTAWAARTAGR